MTLSLRISWDLTSRFTIWVAFINQLENLPHVMLSKTENIFMALFYHTEDIKNFGWEKVFDPLVKELVQLETDGIYLEMDGNDLSRH
jgi:hypothetical protein